MNRMREIIKIRAKMNEMETEKTYKELMKQKAGSLKKINKTDRPMANLTKMRREKPRLVKLEMQNGR
jgi:hypothetical protein